MSTSGGFSPPGPPACPAPMTRADLLALRAAFALRPECHYIITDGPFIGTTGNQSATTIEMHAVSSLELSTSVSVQTVFSPNAWVGTYDIDLGAAGSITELADGWGNVVKDPDADSPTVQTAFPWHRGGTLFRDNYVEDASLPGWGTGTAGAARNRIVGSTVDNSGDWTFNDNEVTVLSTVTLAQATGSRSFSRNRVSGSAIFRALLGAAGTAAVSDSEFRDSYVAEVAATSTATVTIDGAVFTGHGVAAVDLFVDGTGTRFFNDVHSTAHVTGQQYNLVGGGTISVTQGSEMRGGRITRDPATTANVTVAQSLVTSLIVQGPGATVGALSISATTLGSVGTNLTQN